MNLSNLKQNHIKLISYMKKHGYSENYIHSVQIEINRILLHQKTAHRISIMIINCHRIQNARFYIKLHL